MWNDIDYESIDRFFLEERVGFVLSTLSERERTVLICRFWMEMTLKECGEFLKLNRERIRQIESKALRNLRHPNRINLLKEFTFSQKEKQEEIVLSKPSLFLDIHFAFREIHLFAKKLPMIHKEFKKNQTLLKAKEVAELAQKKEKEYQELLRENYLRNLEKYRIDKERLFWKEQEECGKSFNIWYKQMIGKNLE